MFWGTFSFFFIFLQIYRKVFPKVRYKMMFRWSRHVGMGMSLWLFLFSQMQQYLYVFCFFFKFCILCLSCDFLFLFFFLFERDICSRWDNLPWLITFPVLWVTAVLQVEFEQLQQCRNLKTFRLKRLQAPITSLGCLSGPFKRMLILFQVTWLHF